MSKPIRGDKFWRSLAILVLCGLVYYFSYDHGRASMQKRLEAEQKSAQSKIEALVVEHARLAQELRKCSEANKAAGGDSAGAPANGFSLRTGQSRLLFGNSLIITLLEVDNLENKLRIQVNQIDDGHLSTAELGAGVSFQLKDPEDKTWALVVTGLSMSSVSFTLIEVGQDKIQDKSS